MFKRQQKGILMIGNPMNLPIEMKSFACGYFWFKIKKRS